MKCAKVRDMLMDYVSREFPLDEEARIHQHLMDCESCRTELESARSACDALGVLGQEEPVPNVLGRVRERLSVEGLDRRKVLWPQLAAAIPVLIITVIVAGWLWQRPANKPETVISKQPPKIQMPAVQPAPKVEIPKPPASVVASVKKQTASVQQYGNIYKPRHRHAVPKPVATPKPGAESMVFIALEPREPDVSVVQVAADGDAPATELTVIQEFDVSGNPTSITIEDSKISMETPSPDNALPGSSSLTDVPPADGLQAYSLDSEGDMYHA